MASSLSLHQKLHLEIERVVQKQESLEHKLKQLFWECTLRCNLNCLHCGSDCKMSSAEKDMPLADFLGVIDSRPSHINSSDITVITTGGEPLVRQDILECGAQIVKRGFSWGMVSNGLLLSQDKLKALVDTGLTSFAMSFDGFEAEHNWMRGNSSSFERADKAIDYLTKTRGLVWDVITCVNSKNIGYLDEFKEYLISKGVRYWRVFTIVPMGRAVEYPELFLSDKQYVELMDFIVRTRREGGILLNYACEGFLGNYEGLARDNYYNCVAGTGVASILNDGSISGCLSIRSNYHQGNIYSDDFWQIWEKGFKQYRNRKWMKHGACATCDAWRYCKGGAMHLRNDNGDMLSCNYQKIKCGCSDS